MYVADSRGTPAPAVTPEPQAAVPGISPGRRAALAPTVLALGTVSLITDVSSEMVT
ncbi:MFS transporter, partial [Streptomyces sp. SID7760]|nr:MFS transporter [Streptomyces sp. SID7760]